MSDALISWSALAGATVSVVIGSLFAGADTALTSLSASRLGALIEQSSGANHAAYERIRDEDAKLRLRYLVGRVAATAVTAVCFVELFETTVPSHPGYAALASTVLLTATFFGASTTLARKYADAASAAAVRFLRPLELLTLPLSLPLSWLGSTLGPEPGPAPPDPKMTEAEVEALVEEGERSGLFAAEPAEMIRNVLEFSERTAQEVMIPRSKVEAIEIDTPIDEALHIVADSGHSRYPVYRGELDNIVGLLYAKDLFKVLGEATENIEVISRSVPPSAAAISSGRRGADGAQATWRGPALKDILRCPANFVAESQLLSSLLREMKARRQHLAIVVDEFGGVSGIVTLEDVLEEIVGEIRDEHDDPDEPAFQDLGNGRVVADADVSLRELGAYLGEELHGEAEYESLGGMITLELGKVPEVGTALTKFGMEFIVRASDEKHIEKVEIVRKPAASASA